MTDLLERLDRVNLDLARIKQQQWHLGRLLWEARSGAEPVTGWRMGQRARGYIVEGASAETRRIVDHTLWEVTGVTGDAVWIRFVYGDRASETWGLLGYDRRWFKASLGCFDRSESNG